MALYLIGLGLADEKDISVKGLEIVKSCDLIYLESYTSLLQRSKECLEQFYGKKVFLAAREFTEQKTKKIINEAKTKTVAFLIVGDPFSATTHIELFRQAKENNVEVKIINNASILTAVGITGLQLYKFGKITSIPFDNPNLETPYLVLKENLSLGLHTLFLLDLKPEENRFMAANEAIKILENIELKKKEKIITDDTLVVGCARLGSDDYLIKAGRLSEIKQQDFGKAPHCLIIPGKLHFMEEELLDLYK
ncbi:diphthine synthase [Candidatus Woesearchaeota archaeon]|nr:diphthine synthase [Candidatus Woesearchaeota archaeon]